MPTANDLFNPKGYSSQKRLSNTRSTGNPKTGTAITKLYDKGYSLSIEHVPTNFKVSFPALLENFSDAYTQTWNAEDVYGRMDPIAVYQHTRRAIAMSWAVVAEDFEQAKENMDVIGALMSFMYPTYSKSSTSPGGAILNQAPLLRVEFMNLIHNGADQGSGLLGYVNGFTVDVNSDEGMFMTDADALSKPAVYPKIVKLNFELNVLHEHPMGWENSSGVGQLRGSEFGFPYRTNNAVPSEKQPDGVPVLEDGSPDGPTGGGGPSRVLHGDSSERDRDLPMSSFESLQRFANEPTRPDL